MVAREVHGGGEEAGRGDVNVRGGLGAMREALEVWNRDAVEGDEVRRVEAEILELELSFWGDKDGDFVAFGGQLIGEVDERCNVANGEPWEHGNVKLGHFLWEYGDGDGDLDFERERFIFVDMVFDKATL